MKISFNKIIDWHVSCKKYIENNNALLLALYPSGESDLGDLLCDKRLFVQDRIWFGCCFLSEQEIKPIIFEWIGRAFLVCPEKTGIRDWDFWAESWRSGKDRSAQSAWISYRTIYLDRNSFTHSAWRSTACSISLAAVYADYCRVDINQLDDDPTRSLLQSTLIAPPWTHPWNVSCYTSDVHLSPILEQKTQLQNLIELVSKLDGVYYIT